MKTEKFSVALGNIGDTYLEEAICYTAKKKSTAWVKWGALAACFCLMVIVAFRGDIAWGPQKEVKYGNTIAYVGWSDDPRLYEEALNGDLIQGEEGEHLPIFKIDTWNELNRFKTTYGNVVSLDNFEYITLEGEYTSSLSFNDAMKKAQWDREIFYEKNSLLIVYVPANSGSLRFCVEKVKTTDTSLCIHVKQANNPPMLTADLAGWFVLMEVSDDEISNYTVFDAVFD